MTETHGSFEPHGSGQEVPTIKMFRCIFCGTMFDTKPFLNNHYRTLHAGSMPVYGASFRIGS